MLSAVHPKLPFPEHVKLGIAVETDVVAAFALNDNCWLLSDSPFFLT